MPIALLNLSTLVPQPDVELTASAVQVQLIDVAGVWGSRPIGFHVARTQAQRTPEPGALTLYLLDDPDQARVLGYHTSQFAKVFVRPILAAGGGILQGGPCTVSETVGHEVIETVVDWECNTWRDDLAGVLEAQEACDRVQGTSYTTRVRGMVVTLPNYLYPASFAPGAPGPYDRLGVTKAPFEISAGGYALRRTAAGVAPIYGAAFPDWKRGLVEAKATRRAALRLG